MTCIDAHTEDVHNCPYSRYDKERVLVVYWRHSCQTKVLPCWWRLFLQCVASNLKCFSLQHICPKWSLLAHWRMHDIKCLQTWKQPCIIPLRDCLFRHLYLTSRWTKLKFSWHITIFIWPGQMYKSERIDFIDTWFIYFFFFCYCLLLENFCFLCTARLHKKQKFRSQREGELGVPRLPYFLSVSLTSGMNICGVAVFCHCRPFLYSFIKINFTWMSDLICCHIDCRYNIISPCNENKFKTDNDVFFSVFCCLICFYLGLRKM